MGDKRIRAWLNDPRLVGIRLPVAAQRGWFGRSRRVPNGCVFLTDEGVVRRAGECFAAKVEGALVKDWVHQATLTIDEPESSDQYAVSATLTVAFAVSTDDAAALIGFGGKFLDRCGATSARVADMVNELHQVLRNPVRGFVHERPVEAFYIKSRWELLRELSEHVRDDLRECKVHIGLIAFLAEVRFESSDYEEELCRSEDDRRAEQLRSQEVRRAEFEAERRRRLREIEIKDRKGELLDRLELEEYHLALQSEGLKKRLVHLIELEELQTRYERLRQQRLEQRVQTARTLQEILDADKPYATRRSAPPDPLWAAFAACLLVAAVAAFVLGLSWLGESSGRLGRIVDLLQGIGSQTVQPASQPETPIAEVAVYRYVGKKPYGREVRGTLEVTTQSVRFTCTGGPTDTDFQIPVQDIKAVAWHGEREPIILTTTGGVAYSIIVAPQDSMAGVVTNMDLYRLLSSALRGMGGRN